MPCFIYCDFNINLRRVNCSHKVREYLSTMLGYGLKPTINICTRETNDSLTLIDNTGYNTANV